MPIIDMRNRSNFNGQQNPLTTIAELQAAIDSPVLQTDARIALTPADADAIKDTPVDQQAIFNTWKRFSHKASGVFPASAAELNAWGFNNTTKRFYNTTNSSTFIGVVSDKKYTDYAMTVKLTSTAEDDDIIGVVVAFYKDPVTGKEFTLSVVRSPGGFSPLYGLVYNYSQTAANGEWMIANGNSTVTWGSGQAGGGSGTTKNWSALPNGTLIKVVRKGDVVDVYTSNWNNPNTILESTKLSVDLSSDPRLHKFRGPSSYGFCALSQANSYWAVQSFSNPQDVIYVLSTGQVWVNDGGVWSLSTDTDLQLKSNSIITDVVSGETFYKEPDGKFLRINGAVVPVKP